jgi:O-antigen/teichoic acid export membrane protein
MLAVIVERMSDARGKPGSHAKRFFHNVLWGWLGVLFALVSGIFMSPYVIHHLGDSRYGIWALALSLVDYYSLVDFGFKSAVMKYSAHYRATGEVDRLETVVATGLLYFSVAALVVCAAALAIAHNSSRFFRVPQADESSFRFLIVAVGLGCGLSVVFGTYSAVLEACGRFDITSRIAMIRDGTRVIACFALLAAGFGITAMGACLLGSGIVSHVLTYIALRRELPAMTFSPSKARLSTLRQLLGYGVHTFVANMSLNVLNQDAPLLVGHFLSVAAAGYFAYPMRLMTYPAELVLRLGTVTSSKVAEFAASDDLKAVARLAVLVNRYCLMLFLPLAVYLSIFGKQLLRVWINPEFAEHGAPLLPVLGVGVVIGLAAQYNSIAVLYGLAKHGSFARAVFAEAVLSVVGLWYVIPRYGLSATACLISTLMIMCRGLYVPFLVSRCLGMSYLRYSWEIYSRPAALITPVAAVAWLVNRVIGQPAAWSVVLGGGAAMAVCYYAAAYFLALERPHRDLINASIVSAFRVFDRTALDNPAA